MHELSMSYAAVESVLAAVEHLRVKRVVAVTLVMGDFCGVAEEAFRFSFPLAAAGTAVAGAELRLEREAVTVYCGACDAVGELESPQRFCCPACGRPTGEVRSGQEMVVRTVEVEEDES
jgi:hydrogenase nickel incorporation protein HypA/HybF